MIYMAVVGHDLAGKGHFIENLIGVYSKLTDNIITVNEPYMDHPSGLKIREHLANKTANSKELYRLYSQNRNYLHHSIIRPALESGKMVISDRCFICSMVYQKDEGMLNVLSDNEKRIPDVIFHVSTDHSTYLARLKKKHNLEVIEKELSDPVKFNDLKRRYKDALTIIKRVSPKTIIIPIDGNFAI